MQTNHWAYVRAILIKLGAYIGTGRTHTHTHTHEHTNTRTHTRTNQLIAASYWTTGGPVIISISGTETVQCIADLGPSSLISDRDLDRDLGSRSDIG